NYIFLWGGGLGLANLIYGNDLLKLTQANAAKPSTDLEGMKACIADALHLYVNELGKDVQRVSVDWNGPHDAHASALICSFVTLVKRFALPIKQIGKVDVEKVPTFVNKKTK